MKYRVRQALDDHDLSKIQEKNRPNEINIQSTIELTPPVNTDYVLAKKSVDYLNSRLDQEVKLNDLIREIGTNKDKLYQVFKTYYKTTVLSWLREQRMQHAANLLKNTSFSIARISIEVSYRNSTNFGVAFKRVFNVSPSHYRNDFIQKRKNQE